VLPRLRRLRRRAGRARRLDAAAGPRRRGRASTRDADPRLVEPLRAFRFIFYAAWIAKRWQDRAFPAAFPHFGTAEYWENETRDLEELAERLASGAETELGAENENGPGVSAEPELTNEDFFWDL
jgi:hypothetical protein